MDSFIFDLNSKNYENVINKLNSLFNSNNKKLYIEEFIKYINNQIEKNSLNKIEYLLNSFFKYIL